MKYLVLALIAFIAITSVNAETPNDYLYRFGNCTYNKDSTYLSDPTFLETSLDLKSCFRTCFKYYNLSLDSMEPCYKENCTTIATNSGNSNVIDYNNIIVSCMSSGVLSFAFILLITIVSSLLANY